MYDENSFKKQLFWIKVKRIFIIILFSAIGSGLGAIISSYIVDILLFPQYLRIVTVTVSTLIFCLIALLITSNTGKDVEDGYWKIEIIKKLTFISKKLDNLENLNKLDKLDKLDNLNKLDELLNIFEKQNSTTTKKHKNNSNINQSNEVISDNTNSSEKEISNTENQTSRTNKTTKSTKKKSKKNNKNLNKKNDK